MIEWCRLVVACALVAPSGRMLRMLLAFFVVVVHFMPSQAAASRPRVVLVAPNDEAEALDETEETAVLEKTAVLEEAALRIVAELEAVGFSVVRVPGEEALGQLVLARYGSHVEVRATSRGLDAPLTQTIDLALVTTTPEVVAIRAVEALRAAMLQSLRHHPPKAPVPSALSKFTRWEQAPSTDDGGIPAPADDRSERSEAVSKRSISSARAGPRRPSAEQRLRLVAAAGPLLRSDTGRALPSAGGQVQVLGSFRGLLFGVLVDGTFLPTRLTTLEGSIEGRTLSVLGRVGWSLRLRTHFELQLAMAAGYVGHHLEGSPAPGFAGSSANHHTFALHADLALGYWFDDVLGILVHGRVGGPVDAPSLVIPSTSPTVGDAEESVRLGRPTALGSISLAWRFL